MTWRGLTQTWHFVEKWAEEQPGAEAIVFNDERLSWSDFKREMDRVARAYLDIGVEPGDRVAFLSMARTEFLTTYMAAGKVGAIWLGLNPKFSLAELRYQIGDSRPKVLIALRRHLDKDLADDIRALAQEFPFLKKILVIGDPVEGAEGFAEFVGRERSSLQSALDERARGVGDDDEALLLYTSGSTGKPKGVVHTHRSIADNIRIEAQKFHLHNRSRLLLHFPINHVAADTELGFASVLAGACLVCMDRFDPVETLRMVTKEKLTVLGQLPTMFLIEMQLPLFQETDWSNVEAFLWAGSKAPDVMVRKLFEISRKTGALLVTGYGSTEVCGFVTYTEREDSDSLDVLVQTAGRAPYPFLLKIVDDNRKEVPDGTVGEIAVAGSFLFKRYLNKPEETAAVIDAEGWYYTGDLAYRDGSGYIVISGRKSEMFKTGGENVFPREIEDVLESHPAVVLAAVVGVPDDIYAEVGWAFVMKKPGQDVAEEELREYCRQRLANFKVPKKFLVRPALPLLPTGKVNKVALKEELRDSPKS